MYVSRRIINTRSVTVYSRPRAWVVSGVGGRGTLALYSRGFCLRGVGTRVDGGQMKEPRRLTQSLQDYSGEIFHDVDDLSLPFPWRYCVLARAGGLGPARGGNWRWCSRCGNGGRLELALAALGPQSCTAGGRNAALRPVSPFPGPEGSA